jgi:hypothetical protein
VPKSAGPLFKLLCLVNPHWAIRTREALIRLLKPRYRAGYPVWRSKPGFGGKP